MNQDSEIIYKGRHYTACVMWDGSLIVTKNNGQGGTRLIGESAPKWIDYIRNADDAAEAHAFCRAVLGG